METITGKLLTYTKWIVITLIVLAIIITAWNFFLIKATYDYIFQYLASSIGLNIWLIRIISIAFSLLVLIYGIKWLWRVLSPSPLIKSKERNNALLGLSALLILFCLMMWFFTKNDIYNKIGEAQKCYAATPDGYEYVDCSYKVHPIYGTEVKHVTPEIAIIIEDKRISEVTRIVPNRNFRFFSPDGRSLIYYYKRPNEKLEFFFQPGRHPQFNEELLPITPEIVKQLFEYYENGKDSMIIGNDIKDNILKAQKEFETKYNENSIKQGTQVDIYESYINPSITNSGTSTDVSVTIVDENGNNIASVSSAIANVYNQTGKKGNTGLLRSSFIHKAGFQELYEGNSDIITKLKLSSHTDYLAIGKIKYSMRQGTLVEGTIICTVSLAMNIISVNSKTLTKSFSFSVNGNGATEFQAKEEADKILVNVYYNEYSSL